MPEKRKISTRKILQLVVTIIVTAGCFTAILGASDRQQNEPLDKVSLHFVNDQYQFVNLDSFRVELIDNKNIKEHKTKLSKIDVKEIEKSALDNPWISQSQVYIDNNRCMQVYVTQRVPVARVFYEDGHSNYIGSTLKTLPLSKYFTYYTTVVTNVPQLKDEKENKNLRASIVKMVKFIEQDSFWSAQIAQISVTPDKKFELIPVLGVHKILFGDTSQMEQKFTHLFAFYKNVLNRIGWDKYHILDLRFDNQIVASPSIPWKPPTATAVSSMDWVTNIITEAAIDSAKKKAIEIKNKRKVLASAGKKKTKNKNTKSKKVVLNNKEIKKNN